MLNLMIQGMRRWIVVGIVGAGWGLGGRAAPVDYYLPDGGPYEDRVPTPAEFFGYEVGDWHLRPDQIVGYLHALAAAAPERAKVEVFGHTHEQRPLVQLVVAAPERMADLEAVRRAHLERGATATRPAVVNLGYSIHGNESSGANASVMVAYWLVASQSEAAQAVRRDVVVLLDPMFNPDGLARFAHWANTHRGKHLVADPNHREHREPWPNGRTNHYWFDLNRDWFPLVHPESRARVARFYQWQPNIMNDHHEMGTDRTFFFQPGVTSRNNPTTPAGVFALQEKLAAHHADALDRVGSFYYSAEGFDDFYVGKGSVYPDLNGGIGILYEQASSRGHVQETDFGDLTFPFSIRNQVLASLSTLEGAVALREDLLAHQAEFYATASTFAGDRGVSGWVFDPAGDPARAWELRDLLARHQIEVRALSRDVTVGERTYRAGEAFAVPADQPQARLLAELFTDRTEFNDTAFYDISAWSVPWAFNLPHDKLETGLSKAWGRTLEPGPRPVGQLHGDRTADVLAYVLLPRGMDLPRALGRLGRAGIVAQVTAQTFRALPAGQSESIDVAPGAIIIPVTRQPDKSETIERVIDEILARDALQVMALNRGLTPDGPDLGSPSLVTVTAGRVAIVVGDGVSPYDAGEVWHTLDQRWDMAPVLLEHGDVKRAELSRYDAMVIVDGSFGSWSEDTADSIKAWTRAGGTLIVEEDAISWAINKLGAKITLVEDPAEATPATPPMRVPFGEGERINRSKLIPGSIFAASVDLTHPLAYGLGQDMLPLFRAGKLVMQPSKSPYQTPLVYTPDPLLAGYATPEDQSRLSNQAAVVIAPLGSGRVVAMTDNPVFRGYWFGAMRLLGNAIFFGPAMKTP
ncbi:DUF4350 domain-containing protein [Synoicihabitans lomoniglobus]|nr:hypothetical protein [Opitutaceae bacterium LMO-M01]